MKLDLRWLVLFMSSLCMQKGVDMFNFALAPFGLYLYIPALFIGYSASFVPFGIGFSTTILLGLALEAKNTTGFSLVPLIISFCILHYIQAQAADKSRARLRNYLQPLNCFVWALWFLARRSAVSSCLQNPLPLLLSLCLSQALLWAISLWYMDLQHRLIVPLQKRLKPSA